MYSPRRFLSRIAGGLLLGALASGAGTAAAQGISPQADPGLVREYDAAFGRMLRDPTNLDLTFHFAELAIRLENHEAAVGALERLLLVNPDLPRVNLELGVLYFRLGSYKIARTYLERAVAGPDVPVAVRTRVQPFLDEIDRRTATSTISGSVFAGLRWQSNANASPAGGSVRTPFGSAALEDQFAKKADLNAFAAATVEHAYDLGTQDGDRFVTDLTAYATRHRTQKQLQVGLLELRAGPKLAVLPDTLDETWVRPYALVNGVRLGHQPYFGSWGGGVEIETTVDDRLRLTGSAQLAARNYQNSGENPNARELTGREGGLELGAAYALAPRTVLQVSGGLVAEETRTAGTTNRELSLQTSLTHEYDAPFGLTSAPWSVTVSATRTWTDYDGPDPTVAPGITRADRDWRFGLANTIGLTDDWALVVSGERAVDRSNLPNYQFDNWTGTVGVSRTF
ncbi:MAG TPA: tetratricopeptide repeat protein [Azospirillaceae bacterium]|nr:tetratricopeptide repeat protein [Azospirillaceae bacterium]